MQDIAQLKDDKKELEKKLQKSKKEKQNIDGQMRELQDQLEAEQYFSVSFVLLSSAKNYFYGVFNGQNLVCNVFFFYDRLQ